MKPIGEASLTALKQIADERMETALALLDAGRGVADPIERARIQWEAIAELHAAQHLENLHRDHAFICGVLAQQGDLQRMRKEGF
ncbi:MAG: hypothetical protein AAFY01_01655 [Pseudomonadota bacterium]